jgi:hypothetical protein
MLAPFPSRRKISVAEPDAPPGGERRIPVLRRCLLRGGLAATFVLLASSASALAFQPLPSGVQVNDDLTAGIDKTLSVSTEGPANADVVGGALTGGKPAVPWAIFRQRESSGPVTPRDQIFARSFAKGSWTTRGSGTVGGRSSGAPQFPGSLNFDQTSDGEVPSIDFAGSERTVPWATWYENTSGPGFENDNIFASRFDNSGDANQGKWIFGGQARGTGGGTVEVPSLNIDPNQSAENPSVAGGSAVDPSKPGPWVTFQEFSGLEGVDQIFVERPIGPGAANCDGVKPEGVTVNGHVPAIGGFCWQQTGVPRVGTEPSLNVDPTRAGEEPDIAFAGINDGVPWVVWYEVGQSGSGLDNNEQVFAAKAVSDGEGANGGFHWVVVGNGLSGTQDTTGTHSFGKCGESQTNEQQCSLNRDPTANAEKPQVAAGTMNPANPTVPWVAWDEEVAGMKQVFVSHLVGSGATAHFELANDGKPLSAGRGDATQPSIAFSGNTPYVTWREDLGGGSTDAVLGHFASPASFVTDSNETSITPTANADIRQPISSGCIATPFNGDGAACQGGALGTPFFLTTQGTTTRGLFATAYEPEAPVSGAATGVDTSQATVSASVNPRGAAIAVSFQFGTSTAYGQSTAAQRIGPAGAATPFSAQLTGLPAGTTIHYRAVAVSDFGTFTGADETLVTAAAPAPPPVAVSAGRASVLHLSTSGALARARVQCSGQTGATCRLVLRLTVTETRHGSKAARHQTRRVVLVGRTSVVLAAGQSRTVTVALNRAGKRLLRHRRVLRARLSVQQLGAVAATVPSAVVTFHKHGR